MRRRGERFDSHIHVLGPADPPRVARLSKIAPGDFVNSLGGSITRPNSAKKNPSESLTREEYFFRLKMVGARGFEPPTTTPQVWCATRLRYAPTDPIIKRGRQ